MNEDQLHEEAALIAQHDQNSAALAAAVDAHKADPSPEALDALVAAMNTAAELRKHYREIGEYVGNRAGVVKTEDGV